MSENVQYIRESYKLYYKIYGKLSELVLSTMSKLSIKH